MANLTRLNPLNWWDESPFDEMQRYLNVPVRRHMVRWDAGRTLTLPMDVIEQDDAYIVEASIPGVEPDDLEIDFNDNVLTIRGDAAYDEEHEGARYVLRERRSGSFARTLTFPMAIDGDAIEASYDNGELILVLPKDKVERTRRINVARGNGRIRGVGVKPDSQGWVQGQATTDRPSTEQNRQRQRWTEGQATDPSDIGKKESAGWIEGQQTIPGSEAPSSEGWIEGEKVASN
ncbi:MAG: Hsp20/alpha crystallin family protein [Anaerolineae bacterium]|nr:Hsp20/alpha crystallin family protein [Anaerolineae bacterium]